MPETSFSDDLKHMVRHTADRARERLASVQNGLPALGNIRAWPRATKIKVGASVAAIALFVGGVAVRGKTAAPPPGRPGGRQADARPAPAETRQAARSYATGKAEESSGSYRAAAESYAGAARQGNKRGPGKLVGKARAREWPA